MDAIFACKREQMPIRIEYTGMVPPAPFRPMYAPRIRQNALLARPWRARPARARPFGPARFAPPALWRRPSALLAGRLALRRPDRRAPAGRGSARIP